LKWLTSLAPQQAKLARWCMSVAEFDFFIEHRPGVTNTVPDALNRQPMSDLPVAEESYTPENGVISLLLVAMSVDVPHHTPTLVSETLNGTLDYLRHVCLLTHTQVHPPASMPVEPENFKEAAAFWCSLAFQFLTFNGEKSKLPNVPQKHLHWAQHFSKRAAIIDGILMYRDEFMDDPNHYRYVVPDDIQLRRHLLRAYHDSPLAMHRGREATYQSLAKDFY